jgi:hypothetical protein
MAFVLSNPDKKGDCDKQWDWVLLSQHPNITMEDVLDNPDLPWNWSYLSSNPNITMAFVLSNPDKKWDWKWLSCNPYITMKDVTSNPDKPWNWLCLSKNKFGYEGDTIAYYSKRRDATVKQMKVFWEELIMVTWHPKGAMFKYFLEEHSMDFADDDVE